MAQQFNYLTVMLPHKQIELKLQAAVREILPDTDVSAVLVRPCDPKFGDYQSNALMSLAKTRKLNPRQLATDVMAKLDLSDVCEKVEIAGAGFLNFRLKNSQLTQTLEAAAHGEHLFFTKVAAPKTIVIDFSSPNVAKPMHVGHIRSTGIGDALQRTLRLLGHRVISDNHIGDWGTQFGYILVIWKMFLRSEASAAALKRCLDDDPIKTMGELYRFGQVSEGLGSSPETIRNCRDLANASWITAPDPQERTNLAREELVKLQAGDTENIAIWKEMIRLSQIQFDTIYARLGVKFDHALGESFYNPWLGEVVTDLLTRGIARESEGAVGVFSDGSLPPKEDPFLVNRDGEWIPDPALIRKSDGGFNYTTTDLATVDYRLKTWSPNEIVYVVDDRQSGHFKKLFLIVGRWKPDAMKTTKLIHVGFGKILGDDGKPFKTRSGDTVKLGDLLDEAVERAYKTVCEKSADLPEAQRREIARVVGIGAVKYADLLPNRQSDYIFSWDKMLALQGNTAPYLLYAYARIKSIFRKSDVASAPCADESSRRLDATLMLVAPEEIILANHLLNFGLTLEAVAEEYRPNYLCNYLFELAVHFSRFFENCPVLKADDVATRDSRLALCDLTARVLKQGLDVLGIETVEQM
jgi:arginyl-tRNA synthetase